MKQATSILLLSVFLFSQVVYFALFIIEQKVNYKNQRIASNHYDLVIKRSLLNPIEEDELLVSGKMHDIIKTETIGATINYYCISDNVEDILINKMDEKYADTKNNNPIKSKLKLPLAKLYINSTLFDIGIIQQCIFYFHRYKNNITIFISNKIYSPPKYLS